MNKKKKAKPPDNEGKPIQGNESEKVPPAGGETDSGSDTQNGEQDSVSKNSASHTEQSEPTSQPEIQKVVQERDVVDEDLSGKKDQHFVLKALLKPISKVDRKRGIKSSLSPDKRKLAKLQLKVLKNQIILLTAKLGQLDKKLDSLIKSQSSQVEADILKSKAISRNYISKQRSNIKAKIAALIIGWHKKPTVGFQSIIVAAKAKGKRNEANFNSLFSDHLRTHDADLYTLVSGIPEFKKEFFLFAKEEISKLN